MKNKKAILQTLFLLFLIVGTVMIVKQNASMPYVKNQGRVFGTYYHATYQAERDMQQLIEAELMKVDGEFSMFNDSSTVSHINRNEEAPLSEMFLEVFNLSQSVYDETAGAFDVTVAPLVLLRRGSPVRDLDLLDPRHIACIPWIRRQSMPGYLHHRQHGRHGGPAILLSS